MRDKQIEELTRIICQSNKGGKCGYDGKPCDCDCGSYQLATKVYNAGYRKASDVANEIIDIINDFFPKVRELTKGGVVVNLLPTMQEALVKKLKKKYESEGEG